MPALSPQKYLIDRPAEHNRINPGYRNVTLEQRFQPVEGVPYIWILMPNNEVILGIEEPWKYPGAFGFDISVPSEQHAFEQLMSQLRDPVSAEQRDWKFGHPTLTLVFNASGEPIDQGEAILGGELNYNSIERTWVLDNMSGRYGAFEPKTNPVDPDVEKEYQQSIIAALYQVIDALTPFMPVIRLKVSFTQPVYDPYDLRPADHFFNVMGLYDRLGEDAFFKIMNLSFLLTHAPASALQLVLSMMARSHLVLSNEESQLLIANKHKIIATCEKYAMALIYHWLPEELRLDSDIVDRYLENNAVVLYLNEVDPAFFYRHPTEATKHIDALFKIGHYHLWAFIEKNQHDAAMMVIVKAYVQSILSTSKFSTMLKYTCNEMELDAIYRKNDKTVNHLENFIVWFGVQRILESRNVFDPVILKEANRLKLDLTQIQFTQLIEKGELSDDFDEFLKQLPPHKKFELLSAVLLQDHQNANLLKEVNAQLARFRFSELARFIQYNPCHFKFILAVLPKDRLVPFMRYLVKLDLENQSNQTGFKINCLFELRFDRTIQLENNKKGLTVSPIHAALIHLRGPELFPVFDEFVLPLIKNAQMAVNLLVSLNKASMRPVLRESIMRSMVGRFAVLTEHDYHYDAIKSQLPERIQKIYDEALQKHRSALVVSHHDIQLENVKPALNENVICVYSA